MGRELPVLHPAGWQVAAETETAESDDGFVTGAKCRGPIVDPGWAGAAGESELAGIHR